VGEAVRQLLGGTWSDLEVVVSDDGDGRDGTAEAVERAAGDDPRVRYHRNPRRLGIPGNLNAALERSSGELVAMCHDHDRYRPDFIARLAAALERHPSALFVHCAIDVISPEGALVATHVGPWGELTPGDAWLRIMLQRLSCPVCALTMVRRRAHDDHGGYDPAFGFVSDVELWMRLATHGDVAYVPEPLVQVRQREPEAGASGRGIALTRTVARIHRLYLPRAYAGPGRRVRALALEARLAWAVARHSARRAAGRILVPLSPGRQGA